MITSDNRLSSSSPRTLSAMITYTVTPHTHPQTQTQTHTHTLTTSPTSSPTHPHTTHPLNCGANMLMQCLSAEGAIVDGSAPHIEHRNLANAAMCVRACVCVCVFGDRARVLVCVWGTIWENMAVVVCVCVCVCETHNNITHTILCNNRLQYTQQQHKHTIAL